MRFYFLLNKQVEIFDVGFINEGAPMIEYMLVDINFYTLIVSYRGEVFFFFIGFMLNQVVKFAAEGMFLGHVRLRAHLRNDVRFDVSLRRYFNRYVSFQLSVQQWFP